MLFPSMKQNSMRLDELRMDRERPETGRPILRIAELAAIAVLAAAAGGFFVWRGRTVEVRTQVARQVGTAEGGPRNGIALDAG